MDLASFLVHLVEKPTILELPTYTAALPRMVFASERHLSDRRFGLLLSLSSHREYLSFGVTIDDMSIMRRSPLEEDRLGAPRTFLLMSYDGQWYSGWQGLSWQYRESEAGFRERYDLVSDAQHRGYQYFVHPNRRHSIFSRAHLLLKLLSERLEDELTYYRRYYSDTDQGDQPTPQKQTPGQHVLIPTFVMRLTGLPLHGDYPDADSLTKTAIKVHLDYLRGMYSYVQFLVRCNEFAFFSYGRKQDYVAPWIRNGRWRHFAPEDNYRHHASLVLAKGVSLGYTTDLVSKLLARQRAR
jgi:hypothetical protein